ncbi:hypothetical protein EON63_17685 [archaeon]|nr:MAG: hypothetical protein EON63_17685 [archaeon]
MYIHICTHTPTHTYLVVLFQLYPSFYGGSAHGRWQLEAGGARDGVAVYGVRCMLYGVWYMAM